MIDDAVWVELGLWWGAFIISQLSCTQLELGTCSTSAMTVGMALHLVAPLIYLFYLHVPSGPAARPM
jgi:hypothetical protein